MGPASSLLAAQGTKMGFGFLKHWAGTEKIRVQSCALLLTRYFWGGLLISVMIFMLIFIPFSLLTVSLVGLVPTLLGPEASLPHCRALP